MNSIILRTVIFKLVSPEKAKFWRRKILLFRGKCGAWSSSASGRWLLLAQHKPETHPSPVLLAQVMDVDTPKACAEPSRETV